MTLPGGWNELRFESDVQFALGVLGFNMTSHNVLGYEVYDVTGRTRMKFKMTAHRIVATAARKTLKAT